MSDRCQSPVCGREGGMAHRLWRRAVRAILLGACLGASTLSGARIAAAETANSDELRQAAETLAPLALETGDGDLLVAVISALLGGGATLAGDDPWGVAGLMARLRAVDADSGLYRTGIARLESRGRGVISGPNRYDSTLAGGAEEEFRLLVAANEHAIAEARLKKGAGAADIDLVVRTAEGEILTSDIGSDTGILGFGAYVEWWPDRCGEVIVTIRNTTDISAGVVFLAPRAQAQSCDE